MKKEVSKFIKSLGASTAYSGNTRTMYIKNATSDVIEQKVIEKFGFGLRFKLETDSN